MFMCEDIKLCYATDTYNMILFKKWKTTSSMRRYAYAFSLGCLFGSALYLMGHNFLYTVEYDGKYADDQGSSLEERYNQLYGSMRDPNRGPPLGRSRFPGTKGPWLTPAPTATFPDDNFETLTSGVPKIIHQTWENTSVPEQFSGWISTWVRSQANWAYMFWTAPGARYFIKKNFHSHFDMYKKYPTKLQKADARRYFIMYHYGGMFADLDMESVFPVDGVLTKYPCILAQEPNVHRAFLYDKELPYVPMPGFMACRPKHPFFKFVIDLLQDYAKDLSFDALKSTGPQFLKDAIDIYVATYNRTEEEYIFLAPANWFLPTYDPMHQHGFEITCTKLYEKLLPYKQQACNQLKAQNFTNNPQGFPYTNHHWAHTASSSFRPSGTIAIQQFVPRALVI